MALTSEALIRKMLDLFGARKTYLLIGMTTTTVEAIVAVPDADHHLDAVPDTQLHTVVAPDAPLHPVVVPCKQSDHDVKLLPCGTATTTTTMDFGKSASGYASTAPPPTTTEEAIVAVLWTQIHRDKSASGYHFMAPPRSAPSKDEVALPQPTTEEVLVAVPGTQLHLVDPDQSKLVSHLERAGLVLVADSFGAEYTFALAHRVFDELPNGPGNNIVVEHGMFTRKAPWPPPSSASLATKTSSCYKHLVEPVGDLDLGTGTMPPPCPTSTVYGFIQDPVTDPAYAAATSTTITIVSSGNSTDTPTMCSMCGLNVDFSCGEVVAVFLLFGDIVKELPAPMKTSEVSHTSSQSMLSWAPNGLPSVGWIASITTRMS